MMNLIQSFKKMSMWRKVLLGLFIVSLALVMKVSWYLPINVKIVDAQTGETIEGAVLLAQWTTSSGIGFRASYNYKVVEVLSDKKGRIRVPGVFRLFVDKPRLVVYKRGYVAWQSEYIFPDYEHRTYFKWRNGYVIELEKFKPEYTYSDHVSFIRGGYSSGVPNGIFKKAWDWETELKDMGE